ncbi:BnaC05g40020D [Brassica napus]|uniref:BnaC05g40020D protein n=1 Tax=Brassica napus TaxID=3708 RepID=A0A078GES7_BRANA|nr:BnaC05g40020D [Brassica napus]
MSTVSPSSQLVQVVPDNQNNTGDSSAEVNYEDLVQEAMESLSLEEGTVEPQIGDVGDGVIDGTTSEGGYLVTMKFGSQVLKGVLYHHAKRPQQAMGTPPSGMPPASQRRAKKKARETTQVDSKKPKFRRSGYNLFFSKKINFFFAEHARLKSKKQVYQDKGVTDGERYRTEIMLEYESAHESDGASASAAATMAQ